MSSCACQVSQHARLLPCGSPGSPSRFTLRRARSLAADHHRVRASRQIGDPEVSGGPDAARAAQEDSCSTPLDDLGGPPMSTTIDTIRNGVDTQKLFATLDLIKQ